VWRADEDSKRYGIAGVKHYPTAAESRQDCHVRRAVLTRSRLLNGPGDNSPYVHGS
jgi:hypothetical protein